MTKKHNRRRSYCILKHPDEFGSDQLDTYGDNVFVECQRKELTDGRMYKRTHVRPKTGALYEIKSERYRREPRKKNRAIVWTHASWHRMKFQIIGPLIMEEKKS